MAPGLLLTDACVLVRGFPKAIKNVVASLDEELEKIRRKYNLPLTVSLWTSVLVCRTTTRFDVFSTVATYELTRQKASLQELYPGQDTLPDRLTAFAMSVNGKYAECRILWEQFKMLYDGYFVHLNSTERADVENAAIELDSTREAIYLQVANLLARSVEWENCLTTALTDKGERAYMDGLEQRRGWIDETFPRHVKEVVDALHELLEGRRSLLQQADTLWDEQVDGWFKLTSDCLPIPQLCSALDPYNQILHTLSTHVVTQKRLTDKLKDTMRCADVNCTTLKGAKGDNMAFTDVQESLRQYETLWIECSRLGESCKSLKADLDKHLLTLRSARDAV